MSNVVKLGKSDKPKEMVDLFEIDGTIYQIPKTPKANIALKYLKNVREHGDDYAAGVMLEDLLGKDGYEALMNYDELDMQDLQAVIMAAQEVLLGAMENFT